MLAYRSIPSGTLAQTPRPFSRLCSTVVIRDFSHLKRTGLYYRLTQKVGWENTAERSAFNNSVAKSAESIRFGQSIPQRPKAFPPLLDAGVGFNCGIRSYRIVCRIKFWPVCLLLGHSLDRLPSEAMLEQSQDPSKRRSRGNTSCQGPIAQRGHPPQLLFYTTPLLP